MSSSYQGFSNLNFSRLLGVPFTTVTPNGGPGGDGGFFGPNTPGTNTGGWQEAVNSLTTGGSIFTNGITYTNAPIQIPQLSINIRGMGTPSFQKDNPAGSTYATPSDGTQIRGTAAGFNSAGAFTGIFEGTQGSIQQGVFTLDSLAVMPAWGTTSANTRVYCVYMANSLSTNRYQFRNHVIFAPWGWTEAGEPIPTSSNRFGSVDISAQSNGGTFEADFFEIRGMYDGGGQMATQISSGDHALIRRLDLWRGYGGINSNLASGIHVMELNSFSMNYGNTGGPPLLTLGEVSNGLTGVVNQVDRVFLESTWPSPLFSCPETAGFFWPTIHVGQIMIWTGSPSGQQFKITNNDALHLIGPCQVYGWNGANTNGPPIYQEFPCSSLQSTAFGGAISTPFGTSTMGLGGSNAHPTSATQYTINVPMDITIGAGTGQSITLADVNGDAVYLGVATMSHVLAYPNWKLTVTYSSLGTDTYYQATVGNWAQFAGTTATPVTSVKYLAMKNLYLTFDSTVTLTTYDGSAGPTSSQGPGNAMDTSLSGPVARYFLRAGQVVVLSALTNNPVVVQN
jgi:hypothetical protein